MAGCFSCFVTLASLFRWFDFTILNWIYASWRTCARAACIWWCICCNKWLCWIALILLWIVSVVIWFVVEVVVTVFCIIISVWCLLCNLICWLGCAGNQGCTDNCLKSAPCDTASVEFDWSPPSTNQSGLGGGGSGSSSGSGSSTPDINPTPGGGGTTTGTFPITSGMIITKVEELKRVAGWRSFFGYSQNVELKISGLSGDESDALQDKVNRHLTRCGCREGKFGILAVGLSLVFYRIALGDFASVSWGKLSVWILLLLIVGALAGKLVGLVISRLRLFYDIHHAFASRP